MAFWGCVLKPGSKQKVENPEGDILHLSQACLHDPKDGKNYVQAIVAGKAYSIACLEKGRKEHDSFDLFFNPQECCFSNSGKSEVHLTGYFEPDEDGEESESEEAGAAAAAPAKSSPKQQAAAHKSPVQKAVEAAAQRAASPKKAAASPKASPKAPAKPAAVEESDDDEDLEEELMMEEGEESEGLEASEEEEAPPAKVGDKRKAAPVAAPAAASPAKKAAKAPEPKGSPKAAAAGGEQAAYVKKLHDYLKQHGKTSVSLLGSKVPRPKDCPKMKAIFEGNKNLFVVAGQDVSAK